MLFHNNNINKNSQMWPMHVDPPAVRLSRTDAASQRVKTIFLVESRSKGLASLAPVESVETSPGMGRGSLRLFLEGRQDERLPPSIASGVLRAVLSMWLFSHHRVVARSGFGFKSSVPTHLYYRIVWLSERISLPQSVSASSAMNGEQNACLPEPMWDWVM